MIANRKMTLTAALALCQVLCCLSYYRVQQLHCGAVVPLTHADHVGFEQLDLEY